MRQIEYIVIHTAGTPGRAVDQSAETIRNYHVHTKGWNDIGYHFVCRWDGSIELGRPIEKIGAGVEGFNARSAHICFTGNGDLKALTPQQWKSGVSLVADLIVERGLLAKFKKNAKRVLGHRECYDFPGVPNTGKSCPGKLVSCKDFRIAVIGELSRRGL